jgi:hypothetical protein
MTITKILDLSTTWFLGKSEDKPLEVCLKDAAEKGHKFICASDFFKDGMKRPTKVYGSYLDGKAFVKATKEVSPNSKCLYEILTQDTELRLIADVEWDLSWCTREEVATKFLEVVTDQFSKIGYEFIEDLLLQLDASQDETGKGSFHFHSPSIKFRDMEDQRKFWNEVYVTLDEERKWWFVDETGKSYMLKTFIDFSIYNKNRQIRTVYSSKMDKNGVPRRPLMPTMMENIPAMEDYLVTYLNGDETLVDVSGCTSEMKCGGRNVYSKKLIQEIADKHDLEVTVDSLRGNLITLKNKTGNRRCFIHGEENKSDNAYLTISKERKLFYHCFDEGCRGKRKLLHTFQDTSKQLDIEANIPFLRYQNDYLRNVSDFESQEKWISRVRKDMNRYCCYIEGTSKPYVLYRKGFIDPKTKIAGIKYISKLPIQFKKTFDQFRYHCYNENNRKSSSSSLIVDLWSTWSSKRKFGAEDCDPTNSVDEDTFNTFEGLAITEEMAYEYVASEQDLTDLEVWLEFINGSWCRNDEKLFQFVIRWFACNVQRPGHKLGTALVLRGEEGAGKGHVVQTLAKIIGKRHFLQPTSQDEVLGDFNEMVDDKLLIYADEMYWGGEKKKGSILKKLLTEGNLTINAKGLPHRSATNRFNMIFASNEEWVVSAGMSSRRYNVLEVDGEAMTKMSSKEKERLCNINPYVVAAFLYKVNLEGFNATEIIETIGLRKQKEHSMSPVHKWYMDELLMGDIFDQQGVWVSKASLYESFIESGMGNNVYSKVSKVQFFKELSSLYSFKTAKKREEPHMNPVHSLLIPSMEDMVNSFNIAYKSEMLSIPLIKDEDDQ